MNKSFSTLVEALHNPACYPHRVARVRLIETHISWVCLAGKFAYKLKKPVNFGFLDFSTLEKRQHFCHEELRLNRRFAPQLYLGVVSIGGPPEKPIIGGTPAIDYAVKMKRFSRHDELDQLLQKDQLSTAQIEQFAEYLADLHAKAPQTDPRSYFGSLTSIKQPVEENFAQIRPLLPQAQQQKQLAQLEEWSRTRFEQLRGRMQKRKTQHFIRECHGDVHLANMLWYEGRPLLFDCIEFNDNLRCIDLVNDYAFLLMDLDDRGAELLSWHFLNRYLQRTGDYQGLALLNYYKSYRAMVRAKVICLRLAQQGLSEKERCHDLELLQSYLDLADGYRRRRQTPLVISHGFSGAGKSTFIGRLAPLCGAVTVHSDIERKRLHGLSATADSNSELATGIYGTQAGRQTYAQLEHAAENIIRAGFPAIVDATFLKQPQRRRLLQLATRLGVAFFILDFPVSEAELQRRVEQRRTQAGEISEATLEVLKQQLLSAEPLTTGEQKSAIRVLPDSSPATIAKHLSENIPCFN